MSLSRPSRPPRPARGLVADLRRSFRGVLAAVVALLLVLAVLSTVVLAFLHPDVRQDTVVTRTMREAHEGMVDMESGLSGWIATGEDEYLAVADHGRATVDRAAGGFADLLGNDAALDRSILDLRLAQEAWLQQWAQQARALDRTGLGTVERSRLLQEGSVLFARYRVTHQTAIDQAAARRDVALHAERSALSAGLGGALLLVVVVALIARHASRRLAGAVARPITDLLAGMDRLAAGHAPEVHDLDGPAELQALARGLEDASEQLRRDRAALLREQQHTERAATVLRSILDVAREIAGSLNVRYVAETLAEAAKRIADVQRAVVWISDGSSLVAIHDSSRPRGTTPDLPPVGVGDGGVGLAARDARPAVVVGDHPGWAFPLIVGGRVVGVLELTDAPTDLVEDLIEPLETLAIHGAAALEAARLHHQSQELAQVDALTQLFNRRRLDGDLQVELERSKRYGRPLGFLLLDVDHFKQLNDTYGHLHGDEVLRMIGETLAGMVRSSDTVYRYGGEEFAVLVREGTVDDAQQLAERLRAALERVFAGSQGFAKVTASFGVTSVPALGCSADELVGAADRALYAAKRNGRNRVEVDEVSLLPA
ncbi:diguanylate cyclase [Egicoccus halophilus]|uniref:Diguanylate cyclase (GGDEF) domain-containing protein n=1 Tax=Egicoccus halophilus TaxID=1670830 RepID=A0A8J3EV16_9ACTN|nr:diguanylate cyclase [Egicoccus halophilus]GGI08777.1 hypothetical protein GCM10011354_30780 [Egicoccus halophilus]